MEGSRENIHCGRGGVCGLENGVMGWIKTNKDTAAEAARTSGSGPQPAPEEPPAGTGEPPDAGL